MIPTRVLRDMYLLTLMSFAGKMCLSFKPCQIFYHFIITWCRSHLNMNVLLDIILVQIRHAVPLSLTFIYLFTGYILIDNNEQIVFITFIYKHLNFQKFIHTACISSVRYINTYIDSALIKFNVIFCKKILLSTL